MPRLTLGKGHKSHGTSPLSSPPDATKFPTFAGGAGMRGEGGSSGGQGAADHAAIQSDEILHCKRGENLVHAKARRREGAKARRREGTKARRRPEANTRRSHPARHSGLDPESSKCRARQCRNWMLPHRLVCWIPDQVRHDGKRAGPASAHHLPPISSIALSNALLLAVRFLPPLRGSSGLPNSARRLDKASLNAGKSTRRPVHFSSVFKRFDAIVIHCFFADTAIQIHFIERRVKAVQYQRLL